MWIEARSILQRGVVGCDRSLVLSSRSSSSGLQFYVAWMTLIVLKSMLKDKDAVDATNSTEVMLFSVVV